MSGNEKINDLLIVCSAYESDMVKPDELKKLYEDINPELLFSKIRESGLSVNIVRANLVRAGIYNQIPIHNRITLDQIAQYEELHTVLYSEETYKLARHLQEHGQTAVFLKGVALNKSLFKKHPSYRQFGDVDLLVPYENAEEIYKGLILKMGYESHCDNDLFNFFISQEHHYAPLSKDGFYYIDLHHRLHRYYQTSYINTNRVINDSSNLRHNDLYIKVPSYEDMLLHLCCHMHGHQVFEQVYKLKQVADIFNFIYHYKHVIDWGKFIRSVQEDRLQLQVCYSLYYTDILYEPFLGENLIDKSIIQKLAPDGFDKEKDAITNRNLFSEDSFGYWDLPFKRRLFLEREEALAYRDKAYFENTGHTFKEEVDKIWVNKGKELGLNIPGKMF